MIGFEDKLGWSADNDLYVSCRARNWSSFTVVKLVLQRITELAWPRKRNHVTDSVHSFVTQKSEWKGKQIGMSLS